MLCVHWLLFARILGAHGLEDEAGLNARLALTLAQPEGLPLHRPSDSAVPDPRPYYQNAPFFTPPVSSHRASRPADGFEDHRMEIPVFAPTQRTWPHEVSLLNDEHGAHHSISYDITDPAQRPAREHQPPTRIYSIPYDTMDPVTSPETQHQLPTRIYSVPYVTMNPVERSARQQQPPTAIAAVSRAERPLELEVLRGPKGHKLDQTRDNGQRPGSSMTRTVQQTIEPPNEPCTTLPSEATEAYGWIGSISPQLVQQAYSPLDVYLLDILKWSQSQLLVKQEPLGWWTGGFQNDIFKPEASRNHKIFYLCIKVAAINSRFLQLFGIKLDDIVYNDEQFALQQWLLQSIFVSNIISPRADSLSIPPEMKALPAHVRHVIDDYLDLEKSFPLWHIIGRTGTRSTIGKVTVVITRAAIYSLWEYYKSLEKEKWDALFPEDNGFLQVLTAVKTKMHTGTNKRLIKNVVGKLKGHSVFPWRAPVALASVDTLKEVFRHERNQWTCTNYIRDHMQPYKEP